MLPGRRLLPGTRIRVRQAIRSQADEWTTQVEGEVLSHGLEKTGAWFAHGKDHKVWLMRIRLRKEDGEITTLNLTPQTRITVLNLPDS